MVGLDWCKEGRQREDGRTGAREDARGTAGKTEGLGKGRHNRVILLVLLMYVDGIHSTDSVYERHRKSQPSRLSSRSSTIIDVWVPGTRHVRYYIAIPSLLASAVTAEILEQPWQVHACKVLVRSPTPHNT